MLCITPVDRERVSARRRKRGVTSRYVGCQPGVFQSTRHLLPGTMTSNTSFPLTYNLVSSHMQMAARSNHCNSASHTKIETMPKKQGRRNNQDSDSISRRSLVPSLTRLRSATIQLYPLPSAIGGMPHSQTIMTPPRQPKPDAIHPSIHRHDHHLTSRSPASYQISSHPVVLVDFPSRDTSGRFLHPVPGAARPGGSNNSRRLDDGTIQL